MIATSPETPEEIERTVQHCDLRSARVTWTARLGEVLACETCDVEVAQLLVLEDVVLIATSDGTTAAFDADGHLLWRHRPASTSASEAEPRVTHVTISRRDEAHVARYRQIGFRCDGEWCRTPQTLPVSYAEVVETRTGDVVDEIPFEEGGERAFSLSGGAWVALKSDAEATLVRGIPPAAPPWTIRVEQGIEHALACPDGDLLLSAPGRPRVQRLDPSGEVVFDDAGTLWPRFPRSLHQPADSAEIAAPRLDANGTGHMLTTLSEVRQLEPWNRTHIMMRKHDPAGSVQWHRVVTSHGSLPQARAILADENVYLAILQRPREGEELLRSQILGVDATGEHCTRFSLTDASGSSDGDAAPFPEHLAAGPEGTLYFASRSEVGQLDLLGDELAED